MTSISFIQDNIEQRREERSARILPRTQPKSLCSLNLLSKIKFIIVLLFSFNAALFSQQSDSIPVEGDSARIVVRARKAMGGEIVNLRWATDKSWAWKETNRCGFVIDRYTIFRNGVALDKPEQKRLVADRIKIADVEEWKKVIEKDSYAAIIAQALFGEKFQIESKESGNLVQIVALAQEQEQRYIFSHYAADMSFDAACLAGWGFTDSDVSKGEEYLYKVSAADDSVSLRVAYGYALVSAEDIVELPAVMELMHHFGDKTITLSWDNARMKDFYTAYWIEKSTDGINFEKPAMPYTPIRNTNLYNMDVVTYLDSLPENGKTYYFRIRGISLFGETGPSSNIVSGQGITQLKYTPQIKDSHLNALGHGFIAWEHDQKEEPLLKCFSLVKASTADGKYKEVMANIPVASRQITYENPDISGYYSIVAIPHKGEPRQSLPVLLQGIDTIPPTAPLGINASIDTSGIVTIRWNTNTEPDLLGYQIYSANRKEEEFIRMERIPFADTMYIDTVSLHEMNSNIYYIINAFDKRYNQSAYSDTVEVRKPMKTAPSSPVFSTYQSTAQGISLSWINSPDKSVSKHALFRQSNNDTVQVLVEEFTDLSTTYLDTLIEYGSCYDYFIYSVSEWGVYSTPSPSLTICANIVRNQQSVQQFKAVADRENIQIHLSWKCPNKQSINKIKIYRSEVENKPSLWKEVPASEIKITDTGVKPGGVYYYLLIPEKNNGDVSESHKVSVNF